jgi:hypothetical protein
MVRRSDWGFGAGAGGPAFLTWIPSCMVGRCDLRANIASVLRLIRWPSRLGETDKDQGCGMARRRSD